MWNDWYSLDIHKDLPTRKEKSSFYLNVVYEMLQYTYVHTAVEIRGMCCKSLDWLHDKLTEYCISDTHDTI